MGFSERFILLLVSLANLFHLIQPVGHGDGEKRRLGVLDADVRHQAQRSSSIEGSGQQTSILKEIDLLLSDWNTTKSSVFDRSKGTPSPMGSEKILSKEGRGTVDDHADEDLQKSVNIIVVTSKTSEKPGLIEACSLGDSPCLIPTSLNGTNLVWDDMKRTLAFAWELHVFGSASLFSLLVLLGFVLMLYVCTLPSPVCEVLTLTNSLVVFSASLRGVMLLLDPYGTRQILSRATFIALHNASVHILLWAQTALALLTLRGLKVLFFQLDVQHWWLVGALGLAHCTSLIFADLYFSAVSYALPLLLQTLSLCWSILLVLSIVMKSLTNLPPFLRSSYPLWSISRRAEICAKRVTAASAVLGLLSTTLHIYNLLWLYGLLGNWRRFCWVWWLCQFWGRILELFWGISLIVLVFWISCTLSKSKFNTGKDKNMLNKMLSHCHKGSLKKSEKTWEELLPNNWSKYKMSRAGISSAMAKYDDQSYKSDHIDPVSTTSCDSEAPVLWHKVSERECVLSLIEFDMAPPSPINLRHSIDTALSGSLFIAPPPSWTLPPAYSSFDWTMDTESITASLEHFQTSESPWFTSETTAITEDELNSKVCDAGNQYELCVDNVTDPET